MTWGLWIKGARASGAKYEGYHGCQSTTGKWWMAEPDSESMLHVACCFSAANVAGAFTWDCEDLDS